MDNIVLEIIVEDKVVSKEEFPNNQEGQIGLYGSLTKLNINSKFNYKEANGIATISYGQTTIRITNLPNAKAINELLNQILANSICSTNLRHMYLTAEEGATEVKYMDYSGRETIFIAVSIDEKGELNPKSKMLIDTIIDKEFEKWKPLFISGVNDSMLKLFYNNRSVRVTQIVTNYIMPKVNKMRQEYLDFMNDPLRRPIR